MPLDQCTDVRSIPLTDLDPEERVLLSSFQEHEEVRLFELMFEERKSEKFAAATCHDRANWVNAIW